MSVSKASIYSQMIKAEAQRLGFMQCGIAQAGFLEEEAPRLTNWLKNQRHGQMSYMENHFDKRLDPRLLVDDAKSVISLSLNYFPAATSTAQSKILRLAPVKELPVLIIFS